MISAPSNSLPSAADDLARQQRGTTPQAALALFDSLAPVTIEQMIGVWRGTGFATGHPLDGLLERYGWHGKRFESTENAHPLVFDDGAGGVFSVNPSLVPMKLVLRHADLLKRPAIAGIARLMIRIARTTEPQARLRMTEFRGVLSATMIYDTLPINDIFRMADADTVMGLMDIRYTAEPFFFRLHREASIARR